MPDQTLIRVRYESNADGKGSGGLTFTDDRPPLMLGEEGNVTPTELAVAANAGILLTVVRDEDSVEEPTGDVSAPHPFVASSLTLDELKAKAEELSVEHPLNVRHAVLAKGVQDAYDAKQPQDESAS